MHVGTTLTNPLRWIRQVYDRLNERLRREPVPWYWQRVTDDPDQPISGIVYVVGEGLHTWKAVLVCPCGCGAVIELSLHSEGRPRWRIRTHADGRVTVLPSVWRTTGCRAHFVVQRGRVTFF